MTAVCSPSFDINQLDPVTLVARLAACKVLGLAETCIRVRACLRCGCIRGLNAHSVRVRGTSTLAPSVQIAYLRPSTLIADSEVEKDTAVVTRESIVRPFRSKTLV